MTNKQILEKAIEKTVKNGYDNILENLTIYVEEDGSISGNDGKEYYDFHINEIIFDPNFAKAYWGEDKIYSRCGCKADKIGFSLTKDYFTCPKCKTTSEYIIAKYAYHQHRMLDEIQAGKNPLKYLEKFL